MGDLSDKNSAASTKIVGADPSTGTETNFAAVDSAGRLAVALSPTADQFVTASLGSLNSTITLSTAGCGAAIFRIDGTWIGIISLYGTVDGTTWTPLFFGYTGGAINESSTTVNGSFRIVGIPGQAQIKLVMTSYTSGSATVSINASVASNTVQNIAQAPKQTSRNSDPSSHASGSLQPLVSDKNGNLKTSAQVTTDEGSFRDDFSGSSLLTTLTGTMTFTNGNMNVVGSGTAFFDEIKRGMYIRKTGDSAGEARTYAVAEILSDSELILERAYGGTTSTTTATISNWLDYAIPSGGSIAVASSVISMTPGTTSGNKTRIERDADYGPYAACFVMSLSQRIANQITYIGFFPDSDTDSTTAIMRFAFDGTDNTKVRCQSASSGAAADLEETLVTLPDGLMTDSLHLFELNLTGAKASFLINKKVVAAHQMHLPGPYDNLEIGIEIGNTGTAASNTTLNLDHWENTLVNRLEMANSFSGDPLPVELFGTNPATGLPVRLQVDSQGRIIVTSNITSPIPAATLTSDTYIAPGVTKYTSYTATESLAIKQFYAAGAGIGKQTLYLYDATASEFISFGDFESAGDVTNWPYFSFGGAGTGTATFSTAQFFTGAGSVAVAFTTSDANHSNGVKQTFSPSVDFSAWRYISAQFYNTVSAGGTYTRTIRIVLSDSAGNTRSYVVSGSSASAPFNASGWIQILGEIENPTSSTGTGFDVTDIVSIELRQHDSANRTGTVYWDTVKLSASLTSIFPIFHPANESFTISIDPVVLLDIGDEIIVAQKNNDSARKELFAQVGMVSTG